MTNRPPLGKKRVTVFTPSEGASRLKDMAFSNVALSTINYFNFEVRYFLEEGSTKTRQLEKSTGII